MRSLILLRGLPGSGKSTLAKLLSESGKYPAFSIDDYFTNEKTGEYIFEYQKNHLAYKHCEGKTKNALIEGKEKIFLHNTFTSEWEIEPYILMAKKYNYQIFVVTVENYHGKENIHEISNEQIAKMAEKYKVKLLV